MRRKRDSAVVVGAVVFAGALLLLGAAVTRATITGPSGAPPLPATPAGDAPDGERSPADMRILMAADPAPGALQGEVLSLAVERAPFDPDRRAPSQRYLLPGERRPPPRPPREPERPPSPEFRVLGTAAFGDGGIAVIQTEDGEPRVVRVGQEIDGYEVSAVEAAAVVMTGQGWDLTFAVADADATGGRGRNSRSDDDDDDDDRNRNRNSDRDAEREAARQLERLTNQVRQRAEALIEQMGPNVRVQMTDDGRAVITGPNGVRREIQLQGTPGAILLRGRGGGGQ